MALSSVRICVCVCVCGGGGEGIYVCDFKLTSPHTRFLRTYFEDRTYIKQSFYESHSENRLKDINVPCAYAMTLKFGFDLALMTSPSVVLFGFY